MGCSRLASFDSCAAAHIYTGLWVLTLEREKCQRLYVQVNASFIVFPFHLVVLSLYLYHSSDRPLSFFFSLSHSHSHSLFLPSCVQFTVFFSHFLLCALVNARLVYNKKLHRVRLKTLLQDIKNW